MFTNRILGRSSVLWVAVATSVALVLGAGVASAAAPPTLEVCHNGKVLSLPVNAVAAHLEHGDLLGNCEAPVCGACPLIFDPVTCANGKTYANSCLAECDGQAGPCERIGICSNIWDPVTCTAPDGSIKTYANQCQANNAGATSCGVVCACPQIYAPVRCSDGTIYINACVAQCNGASGCTPIQ